MLATGKTFTIEGKM